MVIFWLFLIIPSLLFSNNESDFELLMGKGTPAWEYVETPEDIDNLAFFKTLYDQNVTNTPADRIPKIIHFIWLGPAEFPQESQKNIQKWMYLHPDWTFKFWTDVDRPLPCKGMEKILLSEFKFQVLGDCFYQSENHGEKSQVLRYEILFQEGGLYADHDTLPLSSLDKIHSSYDFYCGLEHLKPSILSSSIMPSNHVLASRAHHPILNSSMHWLLQNWNRLGLEYPGSDEHGIINRVSHRTFMALDQGLKKSAGKHGNRDAVFPAAYFSQPAGKTATYVVHGHSGLWHKKNSDSKKKVSIYLNEIAKKNEKTILILYIIVILNIFIYALFIVKIIKKRINEKN